MGAYILRRLLLMIPTILGIMAISFLVVQFAPGGPVEQVIANLTNSSSATDRIGGSGSDFAGGDNGPGLGARNGTVVGQPFRLPLSCKRLACRA